MTSLIPCLKFTVNLYCDAVFSWIHLIIVRASTQSNSKLSLRVTQDIRRRVWEMILRLTCFLFTPLRISHNQIRSNGNFPRSHALKKTNQCLTYTSTELKVVWNISHFLVQSPPYFQMSLERFINSVFYAACNCITSLYLVQHHCNLFCDIVFSRMHSVIVNASTQSNTKLSPCSTHLRHISEHSFGT